MVDEAFGPDAPLDVELRVDALDVLRDVLEWRLVGPRWAAVEEALEAMTAALRRGDVAAFRTAVYELELSGPTRAVEFPRVPVVEPPPPVIDEVNELVYTLDGRNAPPPEA